MFRKKTNFNKVIAIGGLVLFCFLAVEIFAAIGPSLGTITPSSGQSPPDQEVTFTTIYSHSKGWEELLYGMFLINTQVSDKDSAQTYYNQNSNKLYIRNDAGTAWIGGFAPGSNQTIENSQIKLNCLATTVQGSGNTLTVNWAITFKQSYTGRTYNTYLYAKDDNKARAKWKQKGTWTVGTSSTPPGPSLGTVTPSSGQSPPEQEVSFATTYTHSDGWQEFLYGMFLVNTGISDKNCLQTYYNQNTDKLYIRNDTGTAWIGGFAPGSNNIIENSQAKFNCLTTTVEGSGDTLTVNWAITFKQAFSGKTYNTYLYAKDTKK